MIGRLQGRSSLRPSDITVVLRGKLYMYITNHALLVDRDFKVELEVLLIRKEECNRPRS